jgi:biopolymer transport protein ExbB
MQSRSLGTAELPSAHWLGLGALVCLVLGIALSSGLPAGAEEADEAVETEEEADAPANNAADTSEAPPGEAAPSEQAPAPAKKSYLQWTFEGLGVMYSVIFLTLSFILVALFVMNLIQARRTNVVPPVLVEEFEGLLNEKKYQEAYELAKSDESMLGQVLSAGLAKLSTGYPQAIEAMQEVGEEENMKLDHRLSYMALIGMISPMFGLLGTVQGMIGAFETLATTNTGAPDPQKLAGDISLALFTTLVGLMIAIPAIGAYNILRNRIARLVLEVGIVSEGLMSRFQPPAAKKA